MAVRKQFLLRIDPEVWADVEKWAADELRSVNAQVEYLLREAVKRRKGGRAAHAWASGRRAGGGRVAGEGGRERPGRRVGRPAGGRGRGIRRAGSAAKISGVDTWAWARIRGDEAPAVHAYEPQVFPRECAVGGVS